MRECTTKGKTCFIPRIPAAAARALSLIYRELYRGGADRLNKIWHTSLENLECDPALAVLNFASGIYEKLLRADQARAVAARTKLPAKVISVGNIVCGGTGKTPLVLWICEHLTEMGLRPAILTRGHGGSGKGAARVVPGVEFRQEGTYGKNARVRGVPADYRRLSEIFGDEPVFMASSLPSTPVWAGRKRSLSGEAALAESPRPDVLVLDDGFQHLLVDRDLDIVLLDSRDPFGNGRALPLGPLREPVSHLARAGAFVLTHADCGRRFEITKSTLERLFPEKPIFSCSHRITGFSTFPEIRGRGNNAAADTNVTTDTAEQTNNCGNFNIQNDEFLRLDRGSIPPEALAGQKAAAFAGIAGPAGFFDALSRLGIDLTARLSFPDHHRYSDRDLLKIIGEAARTGAKIFLTTAKDAVRLPATFLPAVLIADLTLDFGHDTASFGDFLRKSVR